MDLLRRFRYRILESSTPDHRREAAAHFLDAAIRPEFDAATNLPDIESTMVFSYSCIDSGMIAA